MFFYQREYERDQTELKMPNFQQPNSLILKSKPVSHKISDIKDRMQNLELKVIIIEKQQSFMTKKGKITQCLVADQSGSIFMNFYNQTGNNILEGDILYLSGVYSSKYKEMVLIYEGDYSLIKRVGKKYMKFNITRNLSLESLEGEKLKKDLKDKKTLKFADQ